MQNCAPNFKAFCNEHGSFIHPICGLYGNVCTQLLTDSIAILKNMVNVPGISVKHSLTLKICHILIDEIKKVFDTNWYKS